MGSGENILIVEDDEEWCAIYRRAIEAQVSNATVRVAKDLATASRLIDLMKFAVAFVDVGLDISDDRNIDGLLVMEKVRSMGDETSMVVVTGRSGQDVLSITRDAVMKYRAFDTASKHAVSPRIIRDLAAGGLAAYKAVSAAAPNAACEALRGYTDPMLWDVQVIQATKFKGSVSDLYLFLNDLVRDFLPLATIHAGSFAEIDSSANMVHGSYWSRAVGSALLVCFGPLEDVDQVTAENDAGRKLLGRYNCGQLVSELTGHGVKGTVFLISQPQASSLP